MAWLFPPEYVVIDIETANAKPTDAEEWARRTWCPSKTWKAQTIGERYLEVVAKKEQQLALLDTAPVLSVALKTEADCRVLHWLPYYEQQIGSAMLERCASQNDMLARVAGYLGGCTPDTLLVGHNVLRFDLPKLRRGMLICGIRLPEALVWREQPVYDTMREWSRFTLDDRQYIGLGELLEACGLDSHKELLGGALVPELYEAGRYAEILAYAVADLLAEATLFFRMTGRDPLIPAGVAAAADGGHGVIAEAAAREVAAGPSGTMPMVGEAEGLDQILKSLGV